MTRVQVLLPTFNGARFLPEQLASLHAQDHPFSILTIDDGSSDGSAGLVDAWMQAHNVSGHRLSVGHAERPVGAASEPSPGSTKGATARFADLLAAADADIVLLCDQDDVWPPDKISRTADALAQAGPKALVHADARLIDEAGRAIGRSFWSFQGLDPRGAHDAARQLVQNHALGCTIGMDRAMVEQVRPVPAAAMVHDWWACLVAAAGGHVVALDGPALAYRLHGGNAIGAQRWGPRRMVANMSPRRRARHARRRVEQAQALQRRVDLAAATALAGIESVPRARRRRVLREHGIRMDRQVQQLALEWAIRSL